ncbi:MAG: hypothetical protein J5I50_03350 [Chitinophagaceae bacterium]|nr:hypothetical protein [Chitinophagaceae bacterium]
MRTLLFSLLAIALIFTSCSKERVITSPDAVISFSSDTLFFDTVFTTVGSVTSSVKIINENDSKLQLSTIRLAGGSNSFFKINIDGISATEVHDVTMRANDSMYLFVQVTINPNTQQMPFVVEDSIEVSFNGNTKWLQLRAYGQNAIFLRNHTITSDTHWTDSLPYVILGSLTVQNPATLYLDPGTRIFAHADAPFLINGRLYSEGTVASPVVFSGDRTDADYKNLPAGWPGIYFSDSSENNFIKQTIIQNAYQGLVLQGFPTDNNPKLTLSESVIRNIYDAGILALNSSITADNSLIVNCGANIALLLGGEYSFTHCTVASYGSLYITHKNPVLTATDYYEGGGTVYTAELSADFTNCIFWGDNGNVDNEILLGKKGTGLFDVTYTNCIYKAKDPVVNATFQNSILNQPPLFDSINTSKNIYDFRFTKNAGAPAINAGIVTGYLTDIEGKLRDSQPDIGCYEK